MFFEWLGWVAFGFILAYLWFHWENFHAIKSAVHKKAYNAGIIKAEEDPVWARAYRAISWRKESRMAGRIATVTVPHFLRKPVFDAYIHFYKVDMEDVEEKDLKKYSSLNEFFSRRLKPGVRPIADSCLVSPADSHMNHYGQIDDDGIVKDVKGIHYRLSTFLGDDVIDRIQSNKRHGSALWFCVCYLSPSDYHRFHSPADWHARFRRHFTGKLLSVNEKIVNSVHELFDINERVVVAGDWKYGFFSLTAVGATNVGSIEFEFDKHRTNTKQELKNSHDDYVYDPLIKMNKGDPCGRFLFGSTVVLVFEAPTSFQFTVARQEKMQYGHEIGTI